jgi:multidrug efflux pump subunit AcrA (membrane-fusion protein)
MSARMTIDLNSTSQAIVVPISAVIRQATGATVKIIDPQTGARRDQLVALGATTPKGIEITSGIHDGDLLALP